MDCSDAPKHTNAADFYRNVIVLQLQFNRLDGTVYEDLVKSLQCYQNNSCMYGPRALPSLDSPHDDTISVVFSIYHQPALN